MIAASTYLPSAISSTIAASSIHGTGAQNLVSALRNGCSSRVGHCVWAEFLEPAAGFLAGEAGRERDILSEARP